MQLLWPTPLLRRSLPGHAAVNTELVEMFTRDRAANGGQDTSMYSSSDDILQRLSCLALSELFAFVSSSVFEIAQAMNAPIWQASGAGKLQLEIVGAWYQIQNGFGFHDIHNHGNCSWSGVYYVQLDEPSVRAAHPQLGALNGVTRFYGHQLGLLGGAHMDMGNAYLQASSFDAVPEAGTLMVFPSWLSHKAMPYDGISERIIVSFNAQVHGQRGDQAFRHGFH